MTSAFSKFIVDFAAAVILTATIWLLLRKAPQIAQSTCQRFAKPGSPARCMLLAALVLLAIRIAVLPWAPTPSPYVHDEFSHLLVADTLASGRLSNPPHPLWRHLDTIYVLQKPTYSSVYPLGQGFIMAVGQVVFRNPWAGVLIAAAAMSAATTWMLYPLLPPLWACLGGVLAAISYGLAWTNSYWNGAFCAFGGALLFGALRRIYSSPTPTLGAIAGIGWSIVWFIRPFESLLPLLFAWGFFVFCLFRGRQPRNPLAYATLCFLIVLLFAGTITVLHNHAVTGSYVLLPYHLGQKAEGAPQSFLGQPPIKSPGPRFQAADDMYRWQRETKNRAEENPLRGLTTTFMSAWRAYVTPWYTLPFIALLFVRKDKLVVFAGVLLLCALLMTVLYPFFFPHYIAAYTCIIVFLILRGSIRLWEFAPGGRAIGRWAVLLLISGGLCAGLRAGTPVKVILGLSPGPFRVSDRTKVADWLSSQVGDHVVFVNYDANHGFRDEWVYNTANVDSSRIVWCRSLGPSDDTEVVRYYPTRTKWLVQVGNETVRVFRLPMHEGNVQPSFTLKRQLPAE